MPITYARGMRKAMPDRLENDEKIQPVDEQVFLGFGLVGRVLSLALKGPKSRCWGLASLF